MMHYCHILRRCTFSHSFHTFVRTYGTRDSADGRQAFCCSISVAITCVRLIAGRLWRKCRVNLFTCTDRAKCRNTRSALAKTAPAKRDFIFARRNCAGCRCRIWISAQALSWVFIIAEKRHFWQTYLFGVCVCMSWLGDDLITFIGNFTRLTHLAHC